MSKLRSNRAWLVAGRAVVVLVAPAPALAFSAAPGGDGRLGETFLPETSLRVQAQAPAITVSHQARALQPGEVVLVRIIAPAPLASARVSGFGRDTDAVRVMAAGEAGEVWQAVIGIDVEVKPGPATVRVHARTAAGQPATADHVVRVQARSFRERTLRVDPKYVSPPPEVQARITREAKRLNAIYATVTYDHLVAPPFDLPVPHPMNSPFGVQSVYNGQVRGRHNGVDFASPAGTPIRAPAPGRVALADDLYYTGLTVVIDHGQGVYTIFAHLSRLGTAEGAPVASGDVVGDVGSTGRSTGPHLHWSLRVGGARVDPLSLVE
jgi:murein DD-endopeptidase MepM/ murein hydrolase activator NlpD